MAKSGSDLMSAAILLDVRDVCKQFPGVRALDGVELHVAAQEVHALLGENGAGKSTLLKILSGALRADRGEATLDGIGLEASDRRATDRSAWRGKNWLGEALMRVRAELGRTDPEAERR